MVAWLRLKSSAFTSSFTTTPKKTVLSYVTQQRKDAIRTLFSCRANRQLRTKLGKCSYVWGIRFGGASIKIWLQAKIPFCVKNSSTVCVNVQSLLRQFGLRWSTCCFDRFDLKRKQRVSWVARDIVGWFLRNVIMQSLEYKWQNWQHIKKTNKIDSRFHRDGKPTDLTSSSRVEEYINWCLKY